MPQNENIRSKFHLKINICELCSNDVKKYQPDCLDNNTDFYVYACKSNMNLKFTSLNLFDERYETNYQYCFSFLLISIEIFNLVSKVHPG